MTNDDVEWVVNSIAELGVRVGDKFYWLYKYETPIVYEPDDNDPPMFWRPIYKREFGECVHPKHLEQIPDDYMAETPEFGWKPLFPESKP